MHRRLSLAVAAALLLAAGGCGGASRHTHSVSADQLSVALDRQTVTHAALKCSDGQPATGVVPAVDELVAIYRKNPRATYEAGKTMRTVLAEAAESVEGCSPAEARQLRDVLTYG